MRLWGTSDSTHLSYVELDDGWKPGMELAEVGERPPLNVLTIWYGEALVTFTSDES